MIPLSPSLPDITKSQPVRAFRVGQYLALLLESPTSLAGAGGFIKYLYALAVVTTTKPADLVLIVTSELSGSALSLIVRRTTGIEQTANPFLCIFDETGAHHNLGDSPDWAHRDRFTARALEIARERLEIREAPIELKADGAPLSSTPSAAADGDEHGSTWLSKRYVLLSIATLIVATLVFLMYYGLGPLVGREITSRDEAIRNDGLTVYPSEAQTLRPIELGQLILLLMPDKDNKYLGWDHRSQSSEIHWLTDGFIDDKDTTRRQGLVRVHVAGVSSTVLKARKHELAWLISYSTDTLPRHGVQEIKIEPAPTCFGTLYEGCEFDPRPSLILAGISSKLVCKTPNRDERPGEGVFGFLLTHPDRNPTWLRWIESGGSGGQSSWLELRFSPAGEKLCD